MSILYRHSVPSLYVAAFDLDHTLLKAASGCKFPKNKEDAMFAFKGVEKKLKSLKQEGYKIVLFTNQSGSKFKWEDMTYKVDKWLGKDVDIYVSTSKDWNRKPCTGMYEMFLEQNGKPVKIFYVGDAAGRPEDFSDSDLKFAHNAHIPFFVPEAYFEEASCLVNPPNNPLDEIKAIPFEEKVPPKTLILQVGPPACGKSTLSGILKEQYGGIIGNNDTTKSSAKTLKMIKQAFKEEQAVIIMDNTNPSMKSRAPYVELARKHGYQIWALVNITPLSVCHFLNKYRSQKHHVKWIPDIAYHMFKKNFQRPESSECDKIFDYIPSFDGMDKTLLF